MNRILKRVGVGAIVAIFGLLIGVMDKPVAAQNTSSFTINSFKAEYHLNKDSQGRSTLKTVERITAEFPAYDQNHGIERALPQNYDGHSTNLRIESVKDEAGDDLTYSDTQSNGNLVLRIGDADTYVHGLQTYVITYTQRDVTRLFTDTKADEFYWDVNGTEWGQTMNEVSATVSMPVALAKALTGKASCYVGTDGSTESCALVRDTIGSEEVFSLQVNSLTAGENATFAIGFNEHTFSPYEMSWQEKLWAAIVAIWGIMLLIGSLAATVILVRMSIAFYRLLHRVKGRGTIVPEYLPPKDSSVLISAQVCNNSSSDITAQLIDLAVRHYLKIYQTKEKTIFKAAEYEIEIVKDVSELRKEEQALLANLFGANPGIGSRFNMNSFKKNYSLGAKLVKGRAEVQKSARSEYGMYEHAVAEARGYKITGFVLLAFGIVTLSPLVVIVSIVAFIFMTLSWPLTEKGMELKEYLEGLKLYITVAEQERLKMLQSPKGAEKVGQAIDGNDSAQLVKLYERVLPYAVLFGIEKEWTKQLGVYYESANQQPDWYAGNTAFNAAIFSSAVSSFTTQASSYSSSSSSSSGGSSGGGSSGGGGGGGGGGGW